MEKIKNDEYIGNIQITINSYKQKPTGKDISSMKWTQMNISPNILSTFINNGHAFCPTDRSLKKVKECYYICIDVDNSTIPMDEYVNNLIDKPTIYYNTPNNGNKSKSLKLFGDIKHVFRFRLLYALVNPTKNAEEYIKAFKYIVRTNKMQFVDRLQANQYYNGSYGSNPIVTNFIYRLPEEFKDEPIKDSNESNDSKKSLQKKNTTIYSTYSISDDSFLKDYFSMKMVDFIDKYDKEFGIDIKTASDFLEFNLDDQAFFYPDEYFETPRLFYWDKANKGYIIKKWKDGQGRHRNLFFAGMIIKHLNPDFDFDMVLYALTKELLLRYENMDKKFNKEYMVQLTKNVMSREFDKELILKNAKKNKKEHKKFVVNRKYCRDNRLSTHSVANSINAQLRKMKTYADIDYFYEPNETLNGKKIKQKQWVEILNENGVNVSLKTFQRYLKDRGYSSSNESKDSKLNKDSKKRTSEKEYYNSPTYSISDDSFFDGLDYEYYNSNRRFMGICNKIHFGACDFSEELKYFNNN